MDYKRVLRLHYVNGYSSRTIGKQTYDGKSTVAEFLKRFEECKELSWPLSEEVTNEYIENLLCFFNRFSAKSEKLFPVFGSGIPFFRIGAWKALVIT